jgi:hypothetical protein
MLFLSNLYNSHIEKQPQDNKYNVFIADAYHQLINDQFMINLQNFFSDPKFSFIFERIKERSINNILYRQSVILLVYYLVYSSPNVAKRDWPLQSEDIESIFADLGKTIPHQ